MIRSANNTTLNDLTIKNFAFENISEFKYLGFKLLSDKYLAVAVKDRIQAANPGTIMKSKKFLKDKL